MPVQGPFAKIECATSKWVGMKFSPDGRLVLVFDMDGLALPARPSLIHRRHHHHLRRIRVRDRLALQHRRQH